MAQRMEIRQSRARAQAENNRRRKKRRRGRRTLHYTLLIVFLLAVGITLSMTVFFKIEAVHVLGTDKYSPDEVAAASGIVIEDNLLRVDKTAVSEALLAKFPYIETVEIRRKLPPAVEIHIIQAKPEAAIPQGEQVTLINRDGKVLERGVLMVPQEIPLVKGIDASGVAPGQHLKEEETEKLRMLRYLLEAMEQSEFLEITNVDITDPLNMKIVYENRIILELGTEAELPYKLLAIKELLSTKIGPEERGVLDAAEVHKGQFHFRSETGSEKEGGEAEESASKAQKAAVQDESSAKLQA